MKRIILGLFYFLFAISISHAEGYENIAVHPRIFASEQSFEALNKSVKSKSNQQLLLLHECLRQTADEYLSGSDAYKNLYTAASAATSCTYMYRTTGKTKYLKKAVDVVKYLISLPDWQPEKFLNVTQGVYACALLYDWAYDDLSLPLRESILEALETHAIDASNDPRYEHFLRKQNNWNQVCNAGIVLASICLYDKDENLAKQSLLAAIDRNRPVAGRMFAPDGIYPEGPGYSCYGGAWQIAIISSLRSAFGDDAGLSQSRGLDKLGDYLISANGPSGMAFNYSDNTIRNASFPLLWTLADMYEKPYYMYPEFCLASEGDYLTKGLRNCGGLLPLFIFSVDKVMRNSVTEPPFLLFAGGGSQAMASCRTAWNRDAMYLAIKGGNPSNGHSHLDVGSFVFDAYGLRWAEDISGRAYGFYEKNLGNKRLLWMKTPESPRWDLFRYNNAQHNTVTINGRNHAVTGYVPILEVIDEDDRMGASFDMNNAFQGMTMSAVRTAVIADRKRLEVTDEIHASEDDQCTIVWNMATPAKARLLPDGILLSQDGRQMKLTSDSRAVSWFVESSEERARKTKYAPWDTHVGNTMFCGYTITIQKSEQIKIKVILQDAD